MLGLSFPETIDYNVRNVFTDIASRINGFFTKEHKFDGSHSNITADSVSLQGAQIGVPVDLRYDSARYEAFGGGTWTVQSTDQKVLRATRVGQLIIVQFYLDGTVIATDTPEELWIHLPEFHAIPALNIDNAAITLAGGICRWSATLGAGGTPFEADGIGVVSAAADDFSGPTPGTLLVLERFGSGNTIDAFKEAAIAQWGIATDLYIHGTCTFMLQPNNTPSPFFGA